MKKQNIALSEEQRRRLEQLVSKGVAPARQIKHAMPSRFLCNDVQQEGVKPSPGLAFWLFCYAALHNI